MNLKHVPFLRLFQKPAAPLEESIKRVLEQHKLDVLFQPIATLADADIAGHEALIRGPREWNLQLPDALLHAAKLAQHQQEFELACVHHALSQWTSAQRVGRLFINISANSLIGLEGGSYGGALSQVLKKFNVSAQRVVFEVTEHRRFENIVGLCRAAHQLRAAGARIAMDDMRGSESSIKLWFKLGPEFVKLERSLTVGIASNQGKARPVRAIVTLAQRFGSSLVAKDVENEDDLLVLKALGVHMVQGFYTGSPNAQPIEEINRRARTVITGDDPSVPHSMKMSLA